MEDQAKPTPNVPVNLPQTFQIIGFHVCIFGFSTLIGGIAETLTPIGFGATSALGGGGGDGGGLGGGGRVSVL